MDGHGIADKSFGEEHFGSAQLGDRRRTKRLVQLADRIVRHPGGTLPEKIDDPASLKALYRLMNQEEVTHGSVLASSRERTLRLMRETEGTLLLIHDGTELDFSGLRSLEGLGSIGNGNCRGYLVHNVLAVVAESRDVIGLAYQKLAKRPKAKPETRKETRARQDRLSRFWRDASATIPAAPAERRQIEVADRGADVLEFLDFVDSQEKFYLVRSQHNRQISLENREKTKLHDYVRALSAQGYHEVDVQATQHHPARTARVSLAWSELTLLTPKQPRGDIRGLPLTCWAICVREEDPPKETSPLEWILLTNVPVKSLEDAQERIAWYACRWIIEEYHKALKTGCGVEMMQFTTEEGLQPAIALTSVAALFLLNLRNASRHPNAKDRPASDVVPKPYVKMLSLWRYREWRPNMTIHDFYYALARLGGHQNRKHDHKPGWLVLWRGWTKLQPMIEVASILNQNNCG